MDRRWGELRRALSAGVDHAADASEVAHLEAVHVGAHRRHHADDLMPGHRMVKFRIRVRVQSHVFCGCCRQGIHQKHVHTGYKGCEQSYLDLNQYVKSSGPHPVTHIPNALIQASADMSGSNGGFADELRAGLHDAPGDDGVLGVAPLVQDLVVVGVADANLQTIGVKHSAPSATGNSPALSVEDV